MEILSISKEVKASRQWNLANITWGTFFFKDHTENTVEILSIPKEAKASRQWNLFSITWGTFSFKDHIENVVEILFPDPFIKNQNWVCL